MLNVFANFTSAFPSCSSIIALKYILRYICVVIDEFWSTFHDRNPRIHTSYDNRYNKDHILKFAKLAAVYVAELAKGKLSITHVQSN